MNKILLSALCALLLNACSTIDDYMLGPDNTPQPKALNKLPSQKASLTKRWGENTSPKATALGNYYNLTPAILGQVIYSANSNGFVQARLKSSGELLWSTDIKASIASGPKVTNDLLVVGAQAHVVALSPKNGKVLWRSEVSNELLAAPVLSHNRVFAKTIDGQVFSFQSADGKQVWRYTHGSPNLILRASSAPVVVGHLLLSGFSDGKLDAIDIKTGRMVWQRNVSYAKGQSDVARLIDIDATPIVKDNIAYLASYQGNVMALSLTDGKTLWQHKLSTFKDMLLNKESLYVVDARSHVWAINRHTGLVLWQQKTLHDRRLNTPAAASFGLVLTDALGYLHVLSMQTGETLAQEKLAGTKTEVTPLIDDMDVYVLFDNGLLTDYTMVS